MSKIHCEYNSFASIWVCETESKKFVRLLSSGLVYAFCEFHFREICGDMGDNWRPANELLTETEFLIEKVLES